MFRDVRDHNGVRLFRYDPEADVVEILIKYNGRKEIRSVCLFPYRMAALSAQKERPMNACKGER